jgi:predicted RNA-binding Zn-ribbon protein involved in translation (DUF1610 family)
MGRVDVALKCPSCSGPLTIRDGDTHTICPSCSASLVLTNAVRKYVLSSGISSIAVLRSVRRKLQEINPKGVGAARVSKPTLYYVPFWHCSAQVNGYVLGIEPIYEEREIMMVENEGQSASGYAVTVTKKIKTRTGAEAVEREIQLSGSVNISAADLEPLGIPTLSSKSQMSIQGLSIQRNTMPDGLEILDETAREGIFVDPLVTVSEAHAQTAEYLQRLGSGVGHGLEEKWEFSVISGHRDSLVYYPLWVTDFRLGGGSYQVVVDGVTGNVLRGRFPSSSRDRKIITVVLALLWAAALPSLTDMILSGKLNYRSATGSRSSCLFTVLMILGAMAYGTWHLLKILRDMKGKKSDHVIY